MAAFGRCATCKWWVNRVTWCADDQNDWRYPGLEDMQVCTLADAALWTDDDLANVTGSRFVRKHAQAQILLASPDVGPSDVLYTAATFGCVQHEPRGGAVHDE